MQLQARDKRALILGAIVVTLLLAYLLWPRSSGRETSVDLVAADQRSGGTSPAPAPGAAPAPLATAPPPAAVQPQPVQTVQAAPAAPAAPASPIPEGIRLTGVAGGGAIFSFPDGSQRLVRRGRDLAPGVTLQAVRLRDVILAVGPVNYRLGFGGAAVPIQPPPQSAPQMAAPPQPAGAPPPAAAPPGAPPVVAPPPRTFNVQQAR
jgi:hypothetical protein